MLRSPNDSFCARRTIPCIQTLINDEKSIQCHDSLLVFSTFELFSLINISFFFFNRPEFLFHVTRNDTWQISTHLNYRHRDRFNYHTTDA